MLRPRAGAKVTQYVVIYIYIYIYIGPRAEANADRLNILYSIRLEIGPYMYVCMYTEREAERERESGRGGEREGRKRETAKWVHNIIAQRQQTDARERAPRLCWTTARAGGGGVIQRGHPAPRLCWMTAINLYIHSIIQLHVYTV